MALDQDTVLRCILRERNILIGYILSIVHDWHLAEDVFQEVSTIALRKGVDLDNETALRAWVRSTARFTALNAARSRQRRGEILVFDDGILDLLDEQWAAASETLNSGRQIEALRHCVGKLAPNARRLLNMRYHERLSGQSLADRMGKTLNTVYVGLARAHRFLERCVRTRMAAEDALNA